MSAELLDAVSARRACVFVIGGRLFALDVRAVREVVVFDDARPVPLAPPHVIGVASLRGRVMPIVDPARRLGVAARRSSPPWTTLVVAADGCQVALAIDDVLGLQALDTLGPCAGAGGPQPGGGVLGIVRRGDDDVTLLDADRLVAALRPGAGRPLVRVGEE